MTQRQSEKQFFRQRAFASERSERIPTFGGLLLTFFEVERKFPDISIVVVSTRIQDIKVDSPAAILSALGIC